MTTPLPLDTRPHGSIWRHAEVMKVPINYLALYPEGAHNPHDDLKEDFVCRLCSGSGNVQLVDADALGSFDGALTDAPSSGRAYLWHLPTVERNHRCTFCRLIWRTFQPFCKHWSQEDRPNVIIGFKEKGTSGRFERIELLAMIFKATIDNQDIISSGQVYVYEDERIPHFDITQPAESAASATEQSTEYNWRQTKVLSKDKVDFSAISKWFDICKSQHGDLCGKHDKDRSSVKRLIEVEAGKIVEDLAVETYLALSYIWGADDVQYKLKKQDVPSSRSAGFLDTLDSNLPQSILDALQVCRQIGIKYLWIDALCIVQDDDKERDEQISLMDQIYGNALAVLVVAAGDDANHGIPGMGTSARDLATYQETVNGQRLMSSLSSTTQMARRSRWNTRAWTFQECMLAKRLLVFTDSYIFMRCSTSMFRDDVPLTGTPATFSIRRADEWMWSRFNDLSPGLDAKTIFQKQYKKTVASYLRRRMRYDSDAIAAFSGILKVLSKWIGPSHFGLPKLFFGKSLLWDSPTRATLKRRTGFPSWSWAGWQWDFGTAEQTDEGPYGSTRDDDSVPFQIFTVGTDNKLEPFFMEEPVDEDPAAMEQATRDASVASLMSFITLGYEEAEAQLKREIANMQKKRTEDPIAKKKIEDEARAKLVSQFEPPNGHLLVAHTIASDKPVNHLIVFYTSVATLTVSSIPSRTVESGLAHPYDVQGKNGISLFTCHLDSAWRAKQPDAMTFAVVGFKPGRKRVGLMLLENVNGVFHRVNWAWKTSQQLDIEVWMNQDPAQQLIVLG